MTKQQAMIYVAFMVGVAFGAWYLIFMKWLLRDKPENNCVECGGGPCRVWNGGIEACGGAAAMGAESSGADAEAALRTPPLRNEHASCNCQIAHEGPCRSSLSQGELLKRFTKPSPNCKSDLPDNDYED